MIEGFETETVHFVSAANVASGGQTLVAKRLDFIKFEPSDFPWLASALEAHANIFMLFFGSDLCMFKDKVNSDHPLFTRIVETWRRFEYRIAHDLIRYLKANPEIEIEGIPAQRREEFITQAQANFFDLMDERDRRYLLLYPKGNSSCTSP